MKLYNYVKEHAPMYQFPIGKGKTIPKKSDTTGIVRTYQFPIGKGKFLVIILSLTLVSMYQFPIGKGKNGKDREQY